ncbi:sterol O-acyltransferase 1 [Phlebotomus argentipes]|uniref:sterol O-acyltransferase 1 n=1 Tax=Phlebotomus argentipes TaxID=94469 RepID=UPI0028936C16|nr:sterol O-acyltransferase 1 [Phlebotomus argentipes]
MNGFHKEGRNPSVSTAAAAGSDSTAESDGFPRNRRLFKDSTDDVLREMALKRVQERIEILQSEISRDVDRRLGIMGEQLINEMKRFDLNNTELRNLFRDEKLMSNRKQTEQTNLLPEKEFMARNSLLTDLFEVKHIKTIYNLFVVCMIIMFLNTVVGDLVAEGRINLGLSPIKVGFGRFHLALVVWSGMQTATSALYFFFKFWALGHNKLKTNVQLQKIWNYASVVGFSGYLTLFVTLSIRGVLYFDLPQASSLAALLEMCRFTMKAHAFVRSNAPKVLTGKVKSDEDLKDAPSVLPSFKTFQYFLFCPTLVYRDSYPRTKEIRWRVAFFHFLDVFGVILFLSFIFERHLLPNFNQFGESEVELSKLVLSIFGSMMPSAIIFILGFYCLLHAWLNGAAELLRFGDRMFYQDWWNSTSFSMYYRKWNVVVHDWLYTYIYKDLYENVFRGNRAAATTAVFVISAIFHEIALIFAFRFFYPVLFISFAGLGTILMIVGQKYPKAFGNILMWLALFIGNGINYSLYTMESYARRNCEYEDTTRNFFIPISWSCNGVKLDPNWKIQNPFL